MKSSLLALLLVAALLALIWLAFAGERLVPLEPVVPGPRPPVEADPRTNALALSGLARRPQGSVNERRRERNRLALAHREALEAWQRGALDYRAVEAFEQRLWVARGHAGEVPEREVHVALAELLEREAERVRRLRDAGFASEDDLQRATLYLARERHLAGLDDAGDGYEAQRHSYLEVWERRQRTLIEAGLRHREQFLLDLAQLREEFTPVRPAP